MRYLRFVFLIFFSLILSGAMALLFIPSSFAQNAHHADRVPSPQARAQTSVQVQRGQAVAAETIVGELPNNNGQDTNFIQYNGGDVKKTPTNVYLIWYGFWGNDAAINVMSDFVSNIGKSPYMNIVQSYSDNLGVASSDLSLSGVAFHPTYSQGQNVSDQGVVTIIQDEITSGAFGNIIPDPNGIYIVLTASDVIQTGIDGVFGADFCGWHSYTAQFLYAFVGSGGGRLDAKGNPICIAQYPLSPNDNPNADAMVDVVAHELVETITDPHLNAWYDSYTTFNNKKAEDEVGDKCAWYFGRSSDTYQVSNGSDANIHLGSRDFYVQTQWIHAKNQIPGSFIYSDVDQNEGCGLFQTNNIAVSALSPIIELLVGDSE